MLRRLVETAMKERQGADRRRRAIEVGYQFMSAIAGDFANFEEATRALFAGDPVSFDAQTAGWPADINDELRRFLAHAFDAEGTQG
jgi:hypothetical protein